MSNPELDQLSEAARNRGLKLVRSRVRTPTKRGFGKVGLTDKAGKPVFGMDSKEPIANPADVQTYLKKLEAKDWSASLDVASPQRKRTGRAANLPAPANDSTARAKAALKPKTKAKPKPPPRPAIREAKPSDSSRIVELIRFLGHEIDEKDVRRNLARLRKEGESPLVAVLDREVVGLCGISARVMIHRDSPIGRISPLVVASAAQGHGIGRMLVEAAEEWMRNKGCKLVELTSNDRRAEAHAFYRHMGFQRTSIRFAKTLS